MKTTSVKAHILFVILLLSVVGCGQPQLGPKRTERPPKTVSDCNEAFAYSNYAPMKIDIVPLTEYIVAGNAGEESKIEVYVSLLDSFGSQIKSPGIFRFELYQRVPRSAKPKGKRIMLWPDIDLTTLVENDNHWRDFLRAYEFSLPFESEADQNYILEATCISPNGKRLSAEFNLTHTK